MRISGGSARGRNVRLNKAFSKKHALDELRPTSAKVRKALFDILMGRIADARFLDLYAGTGAVGIEALSRGAALVTLVDDSSVRIGVIRELADRLGFGGRFSTVTDSALRYVIRRAGDTGSRRGLEPFDIIFADPPYASEDLEKVLAVLGATDLVSENGSVVVEHSSKRTLPESFGALTLRRTYRYGDTCLSLYRKEAG